MPNIYAALPALGLLQETGLENIRDHIAGLARKMIDGARGLGIRVKTPPESVGPLIVLQCKDAPAVVEALAQKDIVTSNRQDGLRVSFHVYNTSNDVDRVLEVLAENRDKMELEGR